VGLLFEKVVKLYTSLNMYCQTCIKRTTFINRSS